MHKFLCALKVDVFIEVGKFQFRQQLQGRESTAQKEDHIPLKGRLPSAKQNKNGIQIHL